MSKRLVFGVGFNDTKFYVSGIVVDVRIEDCPFYRKWIGMLARCYNEKQRSKYPTYIGCTVCDEWLTFSNFRSWMEKQDWQGKSLDKDLLVKGNKVYSPETCVFVDHMTNSFTVELFATRGDYPLGVRLHKRSGKLEVRCSNPFTKKQETIGYFTCPNEAHLAWKMRKHQHACRLADLQTDDRVATALRTRYL